MKKIVQIILICFMIIGIILIEAKGFNVGTKYSENVQIGINLGKQFDVKDIKDMAKEVFKGENVVVQQVELYKEMVQITVKQATDEQIEELNTKINEKYEINNEVSSLSITKNANTRLRNIVKPFILPIAISAAIISVYVLIRFKKLGIWKVTYNIVITIIAPQAILFAGYAITRLPINNVTAVMSIALYIASVAALYIVLNEKSTKNATGNIGDEIVK